MKNLTLVLIVLLFLGCSNQTSLRTGIYKYVRPSRVEFVYLYLTQGIKSCFVGSELVLNNDSTFKYTTCACIMTGKWINTKDSLFLTVIKDRWRNDSLDKNGFNGTWPEIPIKPIGFEVNNDFLIQIYTSKKGEKIIEKLKFNVP